MKNEKWKIEGQTRGNKICRILFCVLSLVFCVFSASAQSTDQSFPTSIKSNEIGGKIAARDVGDPRLTSYFFVFNGTQGDVFLNVKTANFDGDIDVFAAENLRPLTKITVFSDVPQTETGRVIYLRKPERMILRVQGRSPNDSPATFSLKFAGSFAPALTIAGADAPELPQVKTENQSDIQVNSVGTIISVKPKPAPTPSETAKKTEDTAEETKSSEEKTNDEKAAEDLPPANEAEKTSDAATKSVAVVTDSTTENASTATPKKPRRRRAAPTRKSRAAMNGKTSEENVADTKNTAAKKSPAPNALENVRLLILFKDGTKIERQMSEVLRVGVDKSGVLTLITKDGAIARYSILDVEKMTIE
ncbi:MAG: hypothetical protein H0U87_01830 [Acidobacteria bacterium]|nr:hypothetical protein [Acidobacteriota bacterium]